MWTSSFCCFVLVSCFVQNSKRNEGRMNGRGKSSKLMKKKKKKKTKKQKKQETRWMILFCIFSICVLSFYFSLPSFAYKGILLFALCLALSLISCVTIFLKTHVFALPCIKQKQAKKKRTADHVAQVYNTHQIQWIIITKALCKHFDDMIIEWPEGEYFNSKIMILIQEKKKSNAKLYIVECELNCIRSLCAVLLFYWRPQRSHSSAAMFCTSKDEEKKKHGISRSPRTFLPNTIQ